MSLSTAAPSSDYLRTMTTDPIAQPPALEQACAGCGEVLNLAYPYAKLDPNGECAPTHLSDDCFSRALEKRKSRVNQVEP